MFKFLVPFLLIATLASAQEVPLNKLHNHFDPMASPDGTLQTVSPVIEKLAPLPVAVPQMANRCTSDDLKTVSAYFHSYGYTALLTAHDKSRDFVLDEVMYNKGDNSILALTLVYDAKLSDDEDAPKPNLVKICTAFQGVGTFGDGPAFKDFVLGQKMAELNAKSNERDEFMLKSSKGEVKDKDGEAVHEEPYQGDPSKVGYIPLD